jgi:c-di-GMP-binding flagellar brake protein YcgR
MSANEVKLDLRPGDRLQLQAMSGAQANQDRIYVHAIGVLAGESIIVTTPEADGKVALVRVGQVFTVRLFLGEHALAFSCQVLRACTHPYPYLHLSYPLEVAKVQIRNAKRVDVRIAISVQNEQPERKLPPGVAATISDLSSTGALLHSETELGLLKDQLSVRAQLPLQCMEQPLPVVLTASIRNVHDDGQVHEGERYHYGVEFGALEVQSSLALRAFIYEKFMATGRAQ